MRLTKGARLRLHCPHLGPGHFHRLALSLLVALSLLAPLAAHAQEPKPPVDDHGTSAADSAAALDTDPIAAQFVQRCAGCHTVGGGALTGPDLLGAQQMSGDKLHAAIKRMEPRVGPLDDALVGDLTTLLGGPDAKTRIDAERTRLTAEAMARFNPSPAEGERLFLGESPLLNGGPPCSGCHAVNGRGGNLALDLSLLGETRGNLELVSSIEKPGFKIMRTVYGERPVTPREAYHLASYFQKVASEPVPPTVPDDEMTVMVIGALLGILLLGMLAFLTRRRAGGTRARLVRDAMRR